MILRNEFNDISTSFQKHYFLHVKVRGRFQSLQISSALKNFQVARRANTRAYKLKTGMGIQQTFINLGCEKNIIAFKQQT